MASTSSAEETSESAAEEIRTRLCEEFASITGTDSAVAQRYLGEKEWEMEVLVLDLLALITFAAIYRILDLVAVWHFKIKFNSNTSYLNY